MSGIRPPFPTETLDLLHRARGGDRKAEAQLVERSSRFLAGMMHSDPRMRVLRQLGIHREDVTAEVWSRCAHFLRTFEYQGPGSLRAFLTVVLNRTLNDQLRRLGALKRGNASAPLSLEEEESLAREFGVPRSREPSQTSSARAGEIHERARAELTPNEYEIWTRVGVEGVDAGDVARALGIASVTVRWTVMRARRKLRTALRRLDMLP